MNHTDRLTALRALIRESDLDSLIVGKPSNIFYLTGFRGDGSYLVVSEKGAYLLVNPLYDEDARNIARGLCEIVSVERDALTGLAEHAAGMTGANIGYPEDVLTCSRFRRLSSDLEGVRLRPVTGLVERLRTIKDQDELDAIRRAQTITEQVFTEVLDLVRVGTAERELAAEIDYRFRLKGADGPAFETIVASGPATSRPHAVPGSRCITHGDFVLFDMGAVVDGYASDMTRTVVVGRASDEQRRVYTVVRDAQRHAIECIRAGLDCSEADARAREVIGQAGYGARFVHSLGHGVGIDVHEQPRLSRFAGDSLAEGMVVTVEPGVYLPGWGGVRIENMVSVRQDGCDDLTSVPTGLVEL